MREILLRKLADLHVSHPWKMLTAVLIITLIMGNLSSRLEVTMRTSDLLPENDSKVVAFNKIVDEFATASNLTVVVQGEEDQIKEFADELAPQILTLRDTSLNESNSKEIAALWNNLENLNSNGGEDLERSKIESEIQSLNSRINMELFQRVDYKSETEFLKDHTLMLIKEEDLRNTKDIFFDPNLTGLLTNYNNSMEKEYVGQEESMSTREKEDGAWMFLDGIQNLIDRMQEAVHGNDVIKEEIQKTADKLLFGEPYMLSYDKQALVMIAIPNFTIMDRDLLGIAAVSVQDLIDKQLKEYPDIKAGISGAIAREHDEDTYGKEAIGSTTLFAIIAILILLMISFRMWVSPFFALITLIVGVIWALGASWIAVGKLNMITSMMSVIILGLGIDFAVHLISSFTERRAAGESIREAMVNTFLKSGKGIITGSATTACAFLTLMISEARGMRELGIVVGIGLLSILLATMFFLPVMLVLREQFVDSRRAKKTGKISYVQKDISFRFLGRIGEFLSRKYLFTISASALVTIMLVWSAFSIEYDYNYMNLEPEGLTSIALMDTVLDKFDLNIEYGLILADDVEESRIFSEQCRELSSVAMTDDISLYLPSDKQQDKRIPHIQEVRRKILSTQVRSRISPDEIYTLIEEIDRLEMNVMEMQDMAYIGGQDKIDGKCMEIVGDPDDSGSMNIIRNLREMIDADIAAARDGLSDIQKTFGPYYKDAVVRMSNTEPIELHELPVTILDRYSNRTRDKFMITVYPQGNLWEHKELLDRFVDDMERVTEKATGSPSLLTALMRIFARDGRNAIMLTLVIVFLLLWLDFRNPGYALMAMIPLACGVFWMTGVMQLFNMKLNMMNMMGLPLIIGIGIDDGVHVIHRWLNEGNGRIKTVYSSTGKAILLTSLTTMLAFGSLGFSIFRGWASFGISLAIGVAACFLTSVIILPGLLGLIERVNKTK
ncbi:RND family transporter [candidate division KSB1 bacterium]